MGSSFKAKMIALTVFVFIGILGLIVLLFFVGIFSARHGKETAEPREVAVTIPEGLNVRQIADILQKNNLFPAAAFTGLAKKDEGYLFPDTYRFYKDSMPADVVAKMKDNFNKKFTPTMFSEAAAEKHTLREIVTMASILEEEVKSTEDRKIVAGILWKRLSLNMGLNVDSTSAYYDTYAHLGLPPTPISNPGMDALLAALRPTVTKYFYYLTGKDGRTHYAATLDEHALNKWEYLR